MYWIKDEYARFEGKTTAAVILVCRSLGDTDAVAHTLLCDLRAQEPS